MKTIRENMSKKEIYYDFGLYYDTLNEYLVFLMDEHKKFSNIVIDKRNIIRKYFQNPEEFEQEINIEQEKEELSDLEIKMDIYFDETLSLHRFDRDYPQNISIEKNYDILDRMLEHFTKIEEYERCALINHIIKFIKSHI